MRRIKKYAEDGKPEYVQIVWSDHIMGCGKCRGVDVMKPASFVNACAEGSQLLMEELVKIRAPVQKKKAEEVRAWAKAAGVFKGV